VTADITRPLGQVAAGLRFESIPTDVVEHLKLCVLDTLG
jgi:2-methylcitrate dehydratase PrpD